MSAHVYRIFDGENRLIYVGSTRGLFARLAAHRSQAWWAYQAAKVKASVYPSIEDARTAERLAIRVENPRWNIMGRWQSRFGWTLGDYRDYITAISLGSSPTTSYNETHLNKVRAEVQSRFGWGPLEQEAS